MPLTGTASVLGPAIRDAIDGVGDKTDRDALFTAMAAAILAHLVANGAVVVANAVPAAPGPVVGTLT